MAWLGYVASGQEELAHAHTTLMALRLLLRDEHFQHLFMSGSDPLPVLTQTLSRLIESHFSPSGGQHVTQCNTDLLKEVTSKSTLKGHP